MEERTREEQKQVSPFITRVFSLYKTACTTVSSTSYFVGKGEGKGERGEVEEHGLIDYSGTKAFVGFSKNLPA